MDIAIILLTLALVGITGYYAWQNHLMVVEMKAARSVGLLPKLVPSMTYVSPDVSFPRVSNVGPGPALDVELTLSFEPGTAFERRWSHPVVTAGEFHEFILKTDSQFVKIGDLTRDYQTLRIVGRCRDALGTDHRFEENVDVRSWWELAKAANERIPHDYAKKSADALEKIAQSLAQIGTKG